jgi:hypothetical protein
VNITGVETIPASEDAGGGYIRVHYDMGANMTVLGAALPDETLAANGFAVGTSVASNYMDIRISQSLMGYSDYVYFDGTQWRSQWGNITVDNFTPPLLTLSHPPIPSEANMAVSLSPRGTTHDAVVDEGTSPVDSRLLRLMVREQQRAVSDYVYWDGTQFVSQNGVFTTSWASSKLTLGHPSASLSAMAALRTSLSPRRGASGVATPLVSATRPAAVDIEFVDAAGNLLTSPNANMRLGVTHGGGGPTPATGPSSGMRFFISRGGGQIKWDPAALTTTRYPSSNIWLFGFMGSRGADED